MKTEDVIVYRPEGAIIVQGEAGRGPGRRGLICMLIKKVCNAVSFIYYGLYFFTGIFKMLFIIRSESGTRYLDHRDSDHEGINEVEKE